jgi:hypothetical protein
MKTKDQELGEAVGGIINTIEGSAPVEAIKQGYEAGDPEGRDKSESEEVESLAGGIGKAAEFGLGALAVGFESAEPAPGQNVPLAELHDQHGVNEVVAALRARGEQNIRAVTANPDWRKTPIQDHNG